MRILGLVILSLAAVIIIFIYDYRARNKKKRVLHELWKITSKTDQAFGMPVRKVRLMEKCNIHPVEFTSIVTKFVNDDILKVEKDTVEFTEHGEYHYKFKVKPKKGS